jgi:hypothetical protein
MSFQCGKEYIERKPTYEFLEKLTLTPYKKIYSINDTITIQYQTNDKKLFDKLTNSLISTDTTQLIVGFSYRKLHPSENTLDFLSDVRAENVVDLFFINAAPGLNNLNCKTRCSDTNYNFKVSFIPKKVGIYSIQPSVILEYCPNKIDRPYVKTQFLFDLADCNKDIWLTIPPSSIGGQLGYTDKSIDRKELFVFRVQ